MVSHLVGSSQLEISNTEAKYYMDGYFSQYPGIKKYMEETIQIL